MKMGKIESPAYMLEDFNLKVKTFLNFRVRADGMVLSGNADNDFSCIGSV